VTLFAIELDDRALALARDGEILASSPSAVFDGSTGEPAGASAWHALRSHPTATSSSHLQSALTQADASERSIALLKADLSQRLAVHGAQGDRVWIAAPAFADAGGLGTVLAIAQELQLPVDGFVDAATATVAGLGLEGNAIVLELGLHHAAATAVDASAGTARRRRMVLTRRGGLVELYQLWLEFISTAMVKRTRFDPLHDAATEQLLFDAVPALSREVQSSGTARAAVSRGTDQFEVELSRDEFVLAAGPLNREVLRLVHELRPAGAPVTLVMPSSAADIPGLRDEIEQFVGCDLVAIPDGFAAAATSLLELPQRTDEAPVHLLRRLPSLPQARLTDRAARVRLGGRKDAGPAPTHLLLEGRAFSIGSDPIVVGRAPGGSRPVVLPEGLAGVSRRHCTFVRDGEQLVLLDHSTHGTFVNGERVAERVRVYAGDRVRLGEPGVELALIAVGEAAAAAP
jgi:hypothetical protein